MILRRLSQSLKEQNWMAICIEFVLLVVGVFLGIQHRSPGHASSTRELADVLMIDQDISRRIFFESGFRK